MLISGGQVGELLVVGKMAYIYNKLVLGARR